LCTDETRAAFEDLANPYQAHQSAWTSTELKQFGFQVIGHGSRGIYGERGRVYGIRGGKRLILTLASLIANPLVAMIPAMAAGLIGFKITRRTARNGG
jgi:hypothetical protein